MSNNTVNFKLNIYCLTALGTKLKVGQLPRAEDGYSYAGGCIFYIDESSHEKVEFFDEHGELITDIQVGSRPYAYKVITPDPDGKKKYYIFYPQLWGSKRWTYYENEAYVYNSLGTTNTIGSGKTNTDIVMAADSGKYVTADSNGYATAWYKIKEMRDGKYGGCDDWFLPSKAELEELRLFMASHASILTELDITNWFSSNYIWSSSEDSSAGAWYWDCYSQAWNYYNKYFTFSVCGVRAL